MLRLSAPTTYVILGMLAGGVAADDHAALAAGETVIVDTVNDTVDFGGARQVGDLPGPDGRISFREACLAVNNTLGPQTIEFAIPQSEWWLYNDRAILRLENGPFSLTDDETTVDFSSQSAFTGDTNPNGNEVGIYGLEPNAWGAAAVWVFGNNCTIKGLDRVMQRGHGVQLQGNDNRVIGCTISGPLYSGVYITGGFGGPEPTGNVVGGSAPGDGNVLSSGNDGVRIDAPAARNVVIGNVLSGSFHGVSVRGSIYTTTSNDNRIGGPTPQERNIIAGAGHYGEEGFPVGAQVNVEYASGTIIQGNYIGTTADGSDSAGQIGPVGVRVLNSNDTVVRDNLIGGIAVDGTFHYVGQRFGMGISILGSCDNTQIDSNQIGTDVAGDGPIPNHTGIALGSWPGDGVPTNTLIGAAGDGNLIAFNELDGISVGGSVGGVSINGNSIDSNGELGIDLGPGANGEQAAPELTAALSTGASITIDGTLASAPNDEYVLEFFANPACDPSGFGEGKLFLGSVTVTADGGGFVAFDVVLPAPVSAGDVVTSTATRVSTGETSEFSACVGVTGGSVPGDLDGDGDVDQDDAAILFNCMNGPSVGLLHGCEKSDLDNNGDTDLPDAAILQLLMGQAP